MSDYLCTVCGYIYKPSENNEVEFEDLSDNWICPVCFAGKDEFEKI